MKTILKSYTVTLHWQGGGTETIDFDAYSVAKAIKKGREWKNNEYGRTRSCNTMPCTFTARRKREEQS